ncbi:hypothetical protein J5X07_04935 [Actinomyces bowdenii]|uniref:Uncharacterized protein n=1 Tax=Actinomyces bowdenii TaxID=131109 RepID=A0A3P1V954_9ACTO|nr:hypothetical protein [Actinomyces bowdenii]MBO3724378.1 hypothetical protein [Actinomyces bowdenii]RRD30744.1 hypothetical protein EII10_01105 [Actinomyces bowdenii]
MPLPSRPGQPPASSSTPAMAAGPTTQAFSPADETSAFPMPGGGQGDESYAEQSGHVGQYTAALPQYTEAFPGSADPTSAFPAPDSAGYEAQAGHGGQYTEAFPQCTEAFPGSADPTSAFPAGAAHTSVMPAAGGSAVPGAPVRTTVMPTHHRPARTPPEPARQPEPRPAPQPAPPRWRPAPAEPAGLPPVGLPRPPQRRRTLALPLGLLMLLATLALLGWGTYSLLISLHVFDLAQGDTSSLDQTAAGAIIGGAVLALLTVITSLVAVARSKPKTAAIALMLGALFLPLGAVAAGGYYGGQILKDRTLAQAHEVTGQVDPEQIDALLGQVESAGIDVPWREELVGILRGADQATAPADAPGSGEEAEQGDPADPADPAEEGYSGEQAEQ